MYRERPAAVPGAVVWHGAAPDGAPPRDHRVLPDGSMDLIWLDGRLVVAGPDTTAQLGAWPAGSGVTGLRFAPGTAPHVLGVPADALTDQRVPLADLWPARTVRRLTGRVEGAAAPGAELERIAADRLAGAGPFDAFPAAVVGPLRRGAAVGAVARAAGLSERQLRRRFHRAFGYGPKTLARILRMGRALDLARAGAPLAGAAAAAGYADQAHMAREVRALAGVPPTALLR
ncbi:helix-turn-helix domain-containing protein [Nocardiopsis trehalosi]|uniref:helix-turn-helix domain-containing protein n=1 Tax=Nocardiopsis trehalosi TaxID=109329 RepID=UPI0008318E0D|nr:helix-turn-helix domain-containing protein [Nocardiopsis trehalosi]